MACVFFLRQFFNAYLPPTLLVAVWTATNAESMSAIDVNNLRFLDGVDCDSPLHACTARTTKEGKDTGGGYTGTTELWNVDIGPVMQRQLAVLHRWSICEEAGHNTSTYSRLIICIRITVTIYALYTCSICIFVPRVHQGKLRVLKF